MINREMLKTLESIKNQEKETGAGLAPKINVYKHRTTLYGTLEKLRKLDTIEQHEAPNMTRVEYTFTTTEFGQTLLTKAKQAELI